MPPLVAHLLPLAIPLDGGWMLPAILPPVIGVAGSPLLRTVQAHLPIFGIGSDLLAVIIGAATALAVGIAADGLPGLILRRHEDPLAITALPFGHIRRCRIRQPDLETDVE